MKISRREYKPTMKFFGESARYLECDPKEKEEAKQYLELWKKFLLRNLERDCYGAKLNEEQWIEREAYLSGSLCQMATLSLKLCIEADFYYELDEKAL